MNALNRLPRAARPLKLRAGPKTPALNRAIGAQNPVGGILRSYGIPCQKQPRSPALCTQMSKNRGEEFWTPEQSIGRRCFIFRAKPSRPPRFTTFCSQARSQSDKTPAPSPNSPAPSPPAPFLRLFSLTQVPIIKSFTPELAPNPEPSNRVLFGPRPPTSDHFPWPLSPSPRRRTN